MKRERTLRFEAGNVCGGIYCDGGYVCAVDSGFLRRIGFRESGDYRVTVKEGGPWKISASAGGGFYHFCFDDESKPAEILRAKQFSEMFGFEPDGQKKYSITAERM